MVKRTTLFVVSVLVASGCGADGGGGGAAGADALSAGAPVGVAPLDDDDGDDDDDDDDDVEEGFENFVDPIPGGNGRACATCHIPSKSFTITPAEVERQFQLNPNGPLFRSIDADDFASDFATVRTKALFRVTIPLPANVKLVDDPAATEVKLFRAVPSVFNVKLSAPYTSDGRAPTLFEQAKGAALEHSRPAGGVLPADAFFDKIVEFQESKFSSAAVKSASGLLDAGQAPPPAGQDYDGPLTPLEQAGFETFK
ncbi:MAG TPA: cytochrome c peroxidase, partial [Polyangiaceae bacterium]|nr:cytochrome c peroxidase [Polyangiaceae bacterium]